MNKSCSKRESRSVIELTELDLENLVNRVASDAANSVSNDIIREGVEKAVTNLLVKFGFDIENPSKVQRDMAFLRDFRTGTSTLKRSILYIFLTVTIPAIIYAVWRGMTK